MEERPLVLKLYPDEVLRETCQPVDAFDSTLQDFAEEKSFSRGGLMMIAFGPIPSRRLGKSLGINNIPPKNCTYTCIYCQVGRTTNMDIERRVFFEPEVILKRVREHLEKIQQPVDYLTFVPDGEPTLDQNLGRTIEILRTLERPIAVISNASLVWRPDVRKELSQADWVSLKVDSLDKDIWRRIDRPNRQLNLSSIQEGILEFARDFEGTLVTETMLVEGVNDGEDAMERIAAFLGRLNPAKAYLSIPTRPPAKKGVRGPDERTMNRAFQIVSKVFPHVEHLTGYEGNEFASTGNIEEDLLSITAVHPLREEAVRELVDRDHASWAQVENLVHTQQLVEVEHDKKKYFTRRWRS